MKPAKFLDEIVALFQGGERQEAFDLLNAYLDEHLDDMHARLLKAQMCMELDTQAEFVGQALVELEPLMGHTKAFKQLQSRVDAAVICKMKEGREHLRRDRAAALACFETACKLSPANPAVPLAAAQAWIKQASQGEAEASESEWLAHISLLLTGEPADEAETADDSAGSAVSTGERFLHLAMTRSAPGDHIHKRADQMLASYWLESGQFERVISWLERTACAPADAAEIQNRLTRQLAGDIDAAVQALLRAGEFAAAEAVLNAWEQSLPHTPELHLLRAEALRLTERPAEALRALAAVFQAEAPAVAEIPCRPALQVWQLARSFAVVCSQCGKVNAAQQLRCALCDSVLHQHKLTTDRYDLADAPTSAVAHVSAAYLLPERQFQERLAHLHAALDMLPEDANRARRSLQEWVKNLVISQPAPADDAQMPAVVRQQQITPEALNQLRQIAPAAWLAIPLRTRLAVVRRLLRAGLLLEARELAFVVFAGVDEAPSVQKLLGQLEAAVTARAASLRREAETALHSGQPMRAAQLAGDALALCPQDIPTRMLRSKANLRLGNYANALGDLHRVITVSRNRRVIREAQLAAAGAMERLWQIDAALAALEGIGGEEADALRARLERRRRSEPLIAVEPVNDLVMVDTLSRVEAQRYYLGYFAVAVRSVGRPWNASWDAWRSHVLAAGYTFVEVLGGLRNAPGDPVFALRFISDPRPDLPERGALTLALMARVAAPDEAACRDMALELWRAIRDILPGMQEQVYAFEPVVDGAELAHLRQPFAAKQIAEIVRREDVPVRSGERYTVYPFTVGGLDLHNLCWTLLRQSAPAMVSVHLQPTSLMAWEQSALNRMMLDEVVPQNERLDDLTGLRLADPVAQWWQLAPGMGQAQVNRRLLDSLRVAAYVLTVNVAGSGNTPLLAERVAAAMFGSARPANDALFGGYEVIYAHTDGEQAAARRNLAAVDVERWGFSAAPAGVPRLRCLVSELEAATAFRLPVPGYDGLPGLPVIDVRPVAPPAGLPQEGAQLGESVVRVNCAALPIRQGSDDRRRHTYIVGRTGTGKTNLIRNLALQDIQAGHGICVVDPHGDLIDDLLTRIPPHRARDVILFDPSDDGRPVGLNLLEHRSETEKHLIVNEFLAMLMRMYDPNQIGITGPRFQHNVRNAMLTVMSVEGSTLIEVVRVLSDARFRQKLLPSVKDPLVRSYWLDQIAQTSDFHKSEILDYIVSKFNPFVGDRRVRHIIGQPKTTINFRRVMDERQILLVNLCKGKIGAENAQFLGLLLVQRLLMTALSRADMPEDQRADFMLYVDEFQNFATKTFGTILSEGRKYGVAAVVANQYLTQLEPTVREAIFGNVGTIISFRVGFQDAAALAPEMYPVFTADDLINLPKYNACVKLLVNGLAARPFTMRTLLDVRAPDHQQAAAIRQASRQAYGRDAVSVEADIAARYASS